MVLETTFRTPTGTVTITDALAMGDSNRGHQLGKGAPHRVLRRATCVEGEVELSLEYVPRPEYGLVHPLLDTGNFPQAFSHIGLINAARAISEIELRSSPPVASPCAPAASNRAPA